MVRAKPSKPRVPKRPSRKVLAEVVRRVVGACAPESIVLFGSAARGEMSERSDLDLLVIKAGKYDHDRVATAIYRSLSEVDHEVDLVLATPETIERYRDSWCLVYYPALREGRNIYGKRATIRRRPPGVVEAGQEQPPPRGTCG